MNTQNGFLAGYGAVDITPPTGEFCSFRLAPNKRSLGVHDSLYVHALYLANGPESLVLVSVDAVALPEATIDRIKTDVTAATGIPAARILVAATHTHNGAESLGEEPFVDNSIQVDRVVRACAKAAITAFEAKFPACLGWGHTKLPGFAKNRFQHRIGGEIDRVDDRLDFLKIEDTAGNHQGILWHFAAHPTTCMKTGYLSSADYYGMANKQIVDTLGGFSVFFNGACGNINPELGERTFERAAHYGAWAADKIVETIYGTRTAESGCLDSVAARVHIPLTEKRNTMLPPDNREEIMDYFGQIESRPIALTERAYDEEWERYQRLRTGWWRHKLIEEFGDRDSETVCIQAHRILDHLILTIPGEIFVEFQFDLQRAFAANRAMIFGYANGYSGYIPDETSYEVDGYETNPSYIHRAGKQAGRRMLEAGRALLKKITDLNRCGTKCDTSFLMK